jgi:hypothetical protein
MSGRESSTEPSQAIVRRRSTWSGFTNIFDNVYDEGQASYPVVQFGGDLHQEGHRIITA